jgi:uroporphyrinogen-III synthase
MLPSKRDSLSGARVALLEARMSGEMGELVRRCGGVPHFAPAVRETTIDCREPVAAFLKTLEDDAPRLVVFLTGAGANALFDEADRQGGLAFLLDALSRATLVCRGPKPAAALKRRGLAPTVSAREPYTTREVLEALHQRDLRNVEVVLVHYGERNEIFARQLHALGAELNELCLYEWQLPEDTQPMKRLISDTIAGEVDVVVFTSQIQGRHLLRVAAEMGVEPALVSALNSRVVVAAVGPVCRAALEQAGIMPHVVPANPKMGPLVAALADHYATTKSDHEDTTTRRRHDGAMETR